MVFKKWTTLLTAPKFRFFYRTYANKNFKLLDVGCGGHSLAVTKRVFPHCEYYGLDKHFYDNEQADTHRMKKFYTIDLLDGDLSILPDNFFDIIIVSHVIEHLTNGLQIIENLCKKLNLGGGIYVEFPSERSLSFPSLPGTLHFCDDDTHIRLYSLIEVCNIILLQGLRIKKAGLRRDMFGIIILPIAFIYRRYIKKIPYACVFWDLFGFSYYLYAEKKNLQQPIEKTT